MELVWFFEWKQGERNILNSTYVCISFAMHLGLVIKIYFEYLTETVWEYLKLLQPVWRPPMQPKCCIYVLCCILYKYYLSSFPAYMEPMLAIAIGSSFHGNTVALGERLMLCCGWYFYARKGMQTYIFRQEMYFKAQKHLAIFINLLDK